MASMHHDAGEQTPEQSPHPPSPEPGEAEPPRGPSPGFAVVGIGASAGGLNAFKQFFSAMPADTSLAFVLVQHLAPTHESLTAELLSRHTAMSVMQVEDEMQVKPNHVYVIPPNRYLTISGERLQLTEPLEHRGVRVPIDFFFRSLAEEQQQRAIGIILSGTGTDGTLGAREIKAAGGMVMVQSPESAEHDGMPLSAIATGVVDYVRPLEQMPDQLIRYIEHWYVNGDPAQTGSDRPPDQLAAIIGLLRAVVKYDFSRYKKGTLTRRIQRRMGLQHIETLQLYLELLRQDKAEVNALFKDLLIGVTNFFREPEAWQTLDKLVIGPLLQGGGSPIRVWVPGCATGEEAYSLAMLLSEKIQEDQGGTRLNIFASDIDQDALAFARAGIYPENIAADVSGERLQQFFARGEHTWRINKEIRAAVVFAEQNVISDPPFSKLDLISCRNLFIYLEPEIQKRILALFHFALKDGGYLFLGNAETISQQQNLFEEVSRKWRIYRRIGQGKPEKLELSARQDPAVRYLPELRPVPAERQGRHLTTLVQDLVMQRYAPACVLVNSKLEVLYLHGPLDDYLQLPAGELRADLIAMAREGLRTKLRAAVLQAIQTGQPVANSEARVKRQDSFWPVQVTVEPLRQPREVAGQLLVTFEEGGNQQRTRIVYLEPPTLPPLDKPETLEEHEVLLQHLENELASTREDLQTTIEELETSNEEFKASNEEVLSINEELQSTNEELETSKEELQSMNEELQTVNCQLEAKVTELESTNNDLKNLLTSIDHPILFLDRRLRIKRFTPATTRLLRMIETDIGRPFSDFARNINDRDLLADAERVLQNLMPIEVEVQDSGGVCYVRRIVPYRTEEDQIDGVVITFTDFSARLLANEFIRLTLEALPVACVLVDQKGAISMINSQTEKLFDYHRSELIGEPVELLIPEQRRHFLGPACLSSPGEGVDLLVGMARELAGRRRDGREIPLEVTLSPVETPRGSHVLAAMTEITQRKQNEQALRESEKRLRQAAEATGFGTFELDLRQQASVWSRELFTIFAQPETLTISLSQVREWVHPADRAQFDLLLAEATDPGGPGHQQAEYRILRQDGQVRWIRTIARTHFEGDGPARQAVRMVGMVQDITEQKQVEQQLQRLNELLEEQVDERTGLLQLVHDITAAANQATTSDEALTYALERICRHTGWQVGHIYRLDQSSGQLVPSNIWYSAAETRIAPGQEETSRTRFSLTAVGMIPEVARTGQTLWVENLQASRLLVQTRGSHLRAGAAILFPILVGTRVEAVLEFYAEEIVPRDERLIEAMRNVGTQLGHTLERNRFEQELAGITEAERQRLGHELHDTLSQQLTGIRMMLAALKNRLPPPALPVVSELVETLQSHLEGVQGQIRTIMAGLLAVDVSGGGLPAALERLAVETSTTYLVACHLECSQPLSPADNFTATQLFLIAREATHNAAKHASATEIVLRLTDQEGVRISVCDNGIGLPPESEHSSGLGLRIMRYRAALIGAELHLESRIEGGTQVSCRLPWPH